MNISKNISEKDKATDLEADDTTLKTLTGRFQLLASKGSADTVSSIADSQIATADATTFHQQWTDLTNVSVVGPGLTVANNKLYGNGTNPGATMVVPINTRMRFRTSINIVAGGADRLVMVGLTAVNAGTSITAGAVSLRGVGIHVNSAGNVARFVSWNAGIATYGQTFTPPYSFMITITRDEYQYTASVATANGQYDVTLSVPLASFTPKQIGIWHSDARGAAGDTITAITGADANTTTPVKTIEILGHSQHAGLLNAQAFHVGVPKTYDSRKPHPLVIYCHGMGATERVVVTNGNGGVTILPSVYTALLDAGYIVASSAAGGTTEAGSGWLHYRDLYRYVRDHYAISQVLILSESFGGIAGLRTIAGLEVPNIAGWLGVYPVVNLESAYNNGFSSAINANYGSLAAAQAADADPMLFFPERFRGIPMRVYHSASDTSVLKSGNIDLLKPRIEAYSSGVTVVTTTGGHGNASNFIPSEVVTFFNQCIGKA